jgi:hypothetical protein
MITSRNFARLALAAIFTLLPAAAVADDDVVREVRRDVQRDVRRDVQRDVERDVRRGVRNLQLLRDRGDHAIVLGGGPRGYLGVHVVDLTPELRRYYRVDEEAGVLVSRVEPDSPAAAAGIAVGDVLTEIDGDEVEGSWRLRQLVGPHDDGETIAVSLVRAGRPLEVSARLEERQGHVLELGRLFQQDAAGRPLLVIPRDEDWAAFGEDWEEFGEQFEDLGEEIGEAIEEAFENPEVRFRIDRELRQREQLERQIELLERRLQELERKLDEQGR